MTAYVQHKGFNPRLLSSRIWGRLPIKNWSVGLGGRYYFDDFLNFGGANILSAAGTVSPTTTTAGTSGTGAIDDTEFDNSLASLVNAIGRAATGYDIYTDVGVTIAGLATDATGAIEVAGNDADNDEGIMQTGGGSGNMLKIDASGAGRIAFECRIKKASVADNACAFFVGLAEEGLAAANALLDGSGELADKDFVGFRVKHDAGEEIDFAWEKEGQTIQEHANIHTMVADTYVKLGFLYDPGNHPDDKKIKLFVDNGEEESVYVTQTQLDASTFPDDEELSLLLATKVGAAAESKLQMDWWALGVEE
tara:strand:- start:2215 stop:3138 length:924 start_codon:yes stop_codon:yes gene_type:complete